MLRSLLPLAVSFAAIPLAVSQFVPTPSNFTKKTGYADVPVRYKEVPSGICELTSGVKSYAGYADVAENEHYFFWFFEARNADPSTAPLTVWINGGPGSSSMIGLFQELGPCRIDADGNVVDNPFAWNNISNVIFIDEPAQVGFSYSIPISGYETSAGDIVQLPNATCPDYAEGSCGTYSYANETLTANTTANAAPTSGSHSKVSWAPSPKSYGGHYGPIFNQYIESQNALIANGSLPHAHHISLETVLIGNGWYDPLTQYEAFYNFTVYPGNTYDYQPFNDSISAMMYNAMYGAGNCYDQTIDCYNSGRNDICSAADNFCYNEVEYVLDFYANRDEYDIRELSPDPYPESYFESYLNTPEVQEAIGAYVNYSSSSGAVSKAFGNTGDDDRESGTIEALQGLAKQGVSVILYAGDADYVCNWLGVEVVANKVNAKGYSSAGYTNISTSDGIVHGQVKQAGKFAFARIYESGHEVPYYQPLASLEMFERAIDGYDIATGLRKVRGSYKTVGTAKSTYREGNSTVQFDVVPEGTPYNTTTNEPEPAANTTNATTTKRSLEGLERRSQKPSRPVRLPIGHPRS